MYTNNTRAQYRSRPPRRITFRKNYRNYQDRRSNSQYYQYYDDYQPRNGARTALQEGAIFEVAAWVREETQIEDSPHITLGHIWQKTIPVINKI